MVKINVTFTFRSPLNIGSGAQQGTLAKRGMLKNSKGWPYVPASALKGRLRHAVEQVAHTLDLQQPICLTNQDMCRTDPCAVCRLFGSPWLPGSLRFADLKLAGPPEVKAIQEKRKYPHTSQRMGVSLNRRRRTAEDALLYSTELLFPGVALEFGGSLEGEISPAQAGLLLAGLQLLPAMGRGKSGGLGWLTAATRVEASVDGAVTAWDNEMLLSALSAAVAEGTVL